MSESYCRSLGVAAEAQDSQCQIHCAKTEGRKDMRPWLKLTIFHHLYSSITFSDPKSTIMWNLPWIPDFFQQINLFRSSYCPNSRQDFRWCTKVFVKHQFFPRKLLTINNFYTIGCQQYGILCQQLRHIERAVLTSFNGSTAITLHIAQATSK